MAVGSDLTADLGSVVNLSATASSPEPGPISYHWIQTAGPTGFAIQGAATHAASFTPATGGMYAFQVAATDSGTVTGTATVHVLVNRAPIVYWGGDRVTNPVASVTLDARDSVDPDGDALTYSWRMVGAPGRGPHCQRSGSSRQLQSPFGHHLCRGADRLRRSRWNLHANRAGRRSPCSGPPDRRARGRRCRPGRQLGRRSLDRPGRRHLDLSVDSDRGTRRGTPAVCCVARGDLPVSVFRRSSGLQSHGLQSEWRACDGNGEF
ncbi:MAG: hypothetical protein HY814_01920 [Candidatus Riflebacteria bacterium]|nr:hypothetical protein [Candidatus Riflebacteria bacterium]